MKEKLLYESYVNSNLLSFIFLLLSNKTPLMKTFKNSTLMLTSFLSEKWHINYKEDDTMLYLRISVYLSF